MKKNAKKLFLLMAVVMMAVVCLAFSASAETYGDFLYFDEDDNTCTVNGYTGTSTSIVIPSEINGKKVTGVGLEENDKVKSVTIPASVTDIWWSSFRNWAKLEKITVSAKNKNYSSDSYGVLFNKDKTELIAYPAKNSRTSYSIPSGVKSVWDDAFKGCKKLKNLTIPASVERLSDYSFYSWASLVKITVSDKNKNFYADKNGVLYSKDKKTLLVFPARCAVTNFTIPSTVEEISSSAFRDCTKLKSVTIPAKVNDFYCDFSGCTTLEKINVSSSNKNYSSDSSGVLFNKDKTTLVKYPIGRKETSYTIPKGVNTIGSGAFQRVTGLKSVTIPNGVTSIGYSAFYECTALKSVVIPEGVEYFGSGVFAGCTSLKSVKFPDSLTGLGCCDFRDCISLETITIPKNVEYVAYCCFDGCTKISKFTVAADNKYLCSDKYGVLYDKDKTTIIKYPPACKATTYKIPAGVTCVDSSAFSNNAYLKYLTISADVEEIWNNMSTLTNLEKVTVSSKNKYFYSDEFGVLYSKENQTIVVYPVASKNTAYAVAEGVTSMSAFRNCVNLKSLYIPASVTAIYSTFENSESLKNIYYPGTKSQWNNIDDYSGLTNSDVKIHYNHKHSYKTVVHEKATLTENGKKITQCVCGKVKSGSKAVTIYSPKTIKLSTTSYTYNGKVKTPSVTVKDSKGNVLKKDTDYTVKYASGRKMPGKYTVTVTFKGKYSGTKKLTFAIKPTAPSISSVTSSAKGKAVIKWNNVSGESGYQVYYSTSKNGTYKKAVSVSADKTSASKSKLTSKKTYYFKVRAYKKTSSGTVFSAWSAVKSVKIK